MKVFFDHSIFTLQKFGGISNYIVNLVEHFSNKINPSIISMFYKNEYLKKCSFADTFFFYNRVGPLINVINKLNKIYFNYKLSLENPEIIHQTYFNEKNIYSKKSKIVVTEYDLIKEKFYRESYKDQIDYKKKLFDQVDQIICISNNTKKDLQEQYSIDPSKISVTHLSVNKNKEYRTRLLNLRPFILFVGQRLRYKNFINLIKAYSISSKINQNFDIVCFGGGKFSKEEKKLFNDLSIDKNNIHYFEGDRLDLNYFYKTARLFIFPSLYEGFGLPLLEAMNMQCPVICSNTSCFFEVVNDAALFFDPKNVESIASSIEDNIYNDQLLKNLVIKGGNNLDKFSWKKCADETEKIYSKII
jgi:glycosyltransferase involved in cell wall biosynthesis